MSHVQPGRAAAAEMSLGTRAAQAGVGLCSTCRHPVRLHGDLGCVTGECFCSSTGAELRSGVAAAPAPVVPPPTPAQLALLDAVCTCGHRRTEHSQDRKAVSCDVAGCRCRQFHAGGPDAPVAAPSEPAPSPAAVAPASAVAPAAEAGPGGEQAAPQPLTAIEAAFDPAAVKLEPGETVSWNSVEHTPGAGWARAKAELGDMVPEITAEDEARLDEIIAAGKAAAKRPRRTPARPAAPTAQVSRAVVGERDAAEGVAAVVLPDAAATDPEPLDLTPFLGASLHCYSAWYCARCYQRRHDPGACPDCRRQLVPVHVVTIPRSVA